MIPAALAGAEKPEEELTAWLAGELRALGFKIDSRDHALLVTLADKREIMVGVRRVGK